MSGIHTQNTHTSSTHTQYTDTIDQGNTHTHNAPTHYKHTINTHIHAHNTPLTSVVSLDENIGQTTV